MKVSGFTFIRNAIKFDFPIVEAITSVLPICDEFIVAVGKSEDDALELIHSINPDKIRIVETKWDDSLREGGHVLAEETNKAFGAISSDSDWAFYIQGDEVVHEKYLETIKDEMLKWNELESIDGLLFNYLHFYGSYDYVGNPLKWYPHEIRIIKNNPEIYSYKDAQGFRKGHNQKLNVKVIDACIYHYGYVKSPEVMMEKIRNFTKLWRDDKAAEAMTGDSNRYEFAKEIDTMSRFTNSHPKVMMERIRNQNWEFDYDISFNKMPIKNKVKAFLERFGIKVGYKNYRVI